MSDARSTRSTSAANVSEWVRMKVISETGKHCWLCDEDGEQVVHLIKKSDSELLSLYIESGTVANIGINSMANLICLCPNCCYSFDRTIAGWVFLPCPLDPFLDRERAFQAARRADPSAIRDIISWSDVLFQPYLIRTGYTTFNWATKRPVKWHGDPVLAVLRSKAIAAGLQRLPVEAGGVPQHVADMYLELVGLYATPAPVIDAGGEPEDASIRVMGPDSIRVKLPSEAAETKKRRREDTPDDCSDGGSSATSGQTEKTGRSNDTQLTKQPYKKFVKRREGLLEKGLRRRKKLAETKAMNDRGSLASSGQPSIPQKRTVLPRAAKRARVIEDEGRDGEIPHWQGEVAQATQLEGMGPTEE